MNRFFLFLVLSLISFFSFANSIDTIDLETYLQINNIQAQATKDGLYYQIQQRGSGAYPGSGDYVLIQYQGKLLDGTVFDASKEEPFVFQLGYRQVIRGWELGIPLFQVGSKGMLYVPPRLGFGKMGAGRVIPPNSALIYEIEILKVMDDLAYDEYMEKLEQRERVAFEEEQREQFVTDKRRINDYAVNNKLRAKRLESGVSYAVSKKGRGKYPENGDLVSIHYEGYLTDGTLFDSSYDRNQTFDFVVGKGQAISGLEEAIRFYKQKGEGWVMIPSKLAYGPMEIDEEGLFIPANSVLVFKIKVIDIQDQSDQ